MKCLDNKCLEEAVENEVYNGVPVRTCKNGHRTAKYVEDTEVKSPKFHEAA